MRESRHVVLCLSKAFFARPWPKAELNAALALQNDTGQKKVLPLILNDKEHILKRYPLIASLAYREYTDSPENIADELAKLAENQVNTNGFIHVKVESIYTGHISNIIASPRASVAWLVKQAKQGSGLKDSLDTGGFRHFLIRWVLVDVNAEPEWKATSLVQREYLRAMVKTNDGIKVSKSDLERLEDIGVYNDIVFHLYAVPITDWECGLS